MMNYTIGTDIGGTFTDCVVIDDTGGITTGKAPSTPDDFSRGFFDAVTDAAGKLGMSLRALLEASHVLVHATTSGTNAVVERKGSRVGLITTAGHEEAILIMRGGGRSKGLDIDDLLFIPGTYKPEPIVPPKLIRGVAERVDSAGDVLVALDEEAVRRAVHELVQAGAEAIAISFLWSFVNPAHERRAQEIVEEEFPGLFVSMGHAIAARLGEYSRTVGAVMNSYIGPLMSTYTTRIVERASEEGYDRPVLFAQCLGGAASHEATLRVPLYTLDSGPVSGIVACTYLGEKLGYPNIISADMGGTTFDVSVIYGGQPLRRETTVLNQYEMFLPVVDVDSVGAGGGSIAWLDSGSNSIKVGPRSAGADPGPLCYAAGGTEPTVTDADVALGIVNPDGFLGGRRKLDKTAAEVGIAALGAKLGMSMEETAAGIQEIIDNVMAEKIRRMIVSRGHDPGNFVVFAFGGAGPTHAGAFARELGVKQVVIPLGDTAAVLSALGTVSADIMHLFDSNVLMTAPNDMGRLDGIFVELERSARDVLTGEGFSEDQIRLSRSVSMKYGAQAYDLALDFSSDESSDELVARFEAEYEARYGKGSGYAPAGIELIQQRLYAHGVVPRIELRPRTQGASNGEKPHVTSRQVWWSEAGGWVDTPVWSQIENVSLGTRIEGPAVLELPDTTLPVRPGESVEFDEFGSLLLSFS